VSIVTLKPASELMPQVQRVVSHVSAQLEQLLPDAEIAHIGATAIPGALTKGDVDLAVRIPPGEFQSAVDALNAHFRIKQPENWTPHFASFGDDDGYELPLGIQLVVKDSEDDVFIFLRDYLISNRDALAEYNRLKLQHAKQGPGGYWQAKNSFLAKILAARQQ
jgi:GrpB-like predicted nucleotidyltransferase (UPF0157 family)